MEHFLAGFFSGLWVLPVVVAVRWIKSAMRSAIRPESDFTD